MNTHLNQRGITNTILAITMALIIGIGVGVAIKNYHQHQVSLVTTKTSLSPLALSNDAAVAATKAAYAYYNNGQGTPTYSGFARMRDSKYVTAKLAAFFDSIDKGKTTLAADPMGCAQDVSDQPRTFTVNATTASTAMIIVKQPFGDASGSGGTSETSVELVKDGGAWKLDNLTCIPENAK